MTFYLLRALICRCQYVAHPTAASTKLTILMTICVSAVKTELRILDSDGINCIKIKPAAYATDTEIAAHATLLSLFNLLLCSVA